MISSEVDGSSSYFVPGLHFNKIAICFSKAELLVRLSMDGSRMDSHCKIQCALVNKFSLGTETLPFPTLGR